MTLERKRHLKDWWLAGVNAAAGKRAVYDALKNSAWVLGMDETSRRVYQPDLIISVGKAASSMCLGALQAIEQSCPSIVVTKYDHVDDELRRREGIRVIESAHPIPDEQSLLAGELILQAIVNLPSDAKLLFLVSGGASSLVEYLESGLDLVDLQQFNKKKIASGESIEAINYQRKKLSRIKNGKLLAHFKGAQLFVLAISDVKGDDISVIGSGIGDTRLADNLVAENIMAESLMSDSLSRKRFVSSKIIASNRIARQHSELAVKQAGYQVHFNEEVLYGDVFERAEFVVEQIKQSEPGVLIWGGEPTIQLPQKVGKGGRNQSLALAIAKGIFGLDNVSVIVGGSDGNDGSTDAAGAIVDGETFGKNVTLGSDSNLDIYSELADSMTADQALLYADAGTFFEKTGEVFITGPTGTNVMDLVIALVD